MRRPDQLLRVGAVAVLEAGLERVAAGDVISGFEGAVAGLEVALPLGRSLGRHVCSCCSWGGRVPSSPQT